MFLFKLKNLVSSGGKGGADFNTCQHKRIPGTRGSVTGGNGAAAFSDAPYTVPSVSMHSCFASLEPCPTISNSKRKVLLRHTSVPQGLILLQIRKDS